jgi:hypothetical protein
MRAFTGFRAFFAAFSTREIVVTGKDKQQNKFE